MKYDMMVGMPLHFAAKLCLPKVTLELLRVGAEVNARNAEQPNTPLHMAIKQEGSEEERMVRTVDCLVAHGADVTLPFPDGTPLLMYCLVTHHFQETAQILVNGGLILDLNTAVALGRVDEVRVKLQNDPDAIRHAPLPKSLLWDLIGWRHDRELRVAMPEMLRLLLDRGIDVRAPEYSTLMLDACGGGTPPEAVKLLLDRGAKVNVTYEGEAPLDVALRTGEEAVVELLKRAGAKKANQIKKK